MSASRSPPSPNTSGPISGSTVLSNGNSSSPLELSPTSSPEKHQSTSPSSPASPITPGMESRQVAPRLANERGSLDDVTHVNGDNGDSSPLTEGESAPGTAAGGSSPMELVDDDMGGTLELEGSDEYIDSYDMQDLRRVKVYELVGQNWKDLGTAFCSGEYDEQIREAQLIAKSEETQEILLQITVRPDDVYQRQADTLIVWTELNGKDYALSFQDVEGCTEVWEFITEVRRHLRATQGELGSSSPFSDAHPSATMARLPAPTLANLAEIERQIRMAHRGAPMRDRVSDDIISSGLVRKLVVLMSDAEDLQSVESLHSLCTLMQAILLLNDQTIYEYILRDDIFIDMVGLLEYDPEFPRLKAHYRDFLRENAKHHQVVEFKDPIIRSKVHHTYRLQYLKDVVLARVLDDPIFNVLNSLIIFNQIDIVTYIQNEEYFLREVFSIFVQHPIPPPSGIPKMEGPAAPAPAIPATPESPTKPEEPPAATTTKADEDITLEPAQSKEDRRAPALLLLHQFCSMGKNVQLPMRLALFRSLVDRGILYPVQWALSQDDVKVLNTAGEILAMVLDHDAGGVRGHVLRQVEEDARREAGEKNAASTSPSSNGEEKKANGSGAAAAASTSTSTATSGSNTPTLLAMMSAILISTQHELSLKSQLADSFRTLMDVPGLDATMQMPALKQFQPAIRKEEQQSDRFLDYFYKRCAGELYNPLLHNVPEHKNVTSFPLELTRAQSDLYLYLCDLLCGFLLQHSYQSHYFVLGNNLASRIASLLFVREKHLRLAALRFFRTCLRLNNRNLMGHLIKHNIFSPILELTNRESARDNLLSSCCQEFFEHIRRENFRDVITHIMKTHEPLVRKLANSPVVGQRFTQLIQRWEMNKEEPQKLDPKPAQLPTSRWGIPRLDPEEDYFDKEEETAVPTGRQTRGQAQKRGRIAPSSNIGTRRTQRPVNVVLPRVYPIGSALVDYQEDEENAEGASPPSPEPKPEPRVQDGTRLRARSRRPELTRNPSSLIINPYAVEGRSEGAAAAGGASTSANAGDQSMTSSSSTGAKRSPSEIGPVAMDEDDDLIGPPVSLSHKRRREAEEEDEGLERLSKRPALSQSAGSSSPEKASDTNGGTPAAGAGSPMEISTPPPPVETPSRGSKRQLRVKLGSTPLVQTQPPDVKVGDKG